MSINELHDLLADLKDKANGLSMEEVERRQHLNEIIESLEEQILSEQGIDIRDEVYEMLEDKLLHFEVEHPAIASVLGSILNTLKSMGI